MEDIQGQYYCRTNVRESQEGVWKLAEGHPTNVSAALGRPALNENFLRSFYLFVLLINLLIGLQSQYHLFANLFYFS